MLPFIVLLWPVASVTFRYALRGFAAFVTPLVINQFPQAKRFFVEPRRNHAAQDFARTF